MRTYELLAIVQPTLEEEALATVVDSILQVMTDNGGEIVHAEVLGKRRLSYAIKRYTDGYYVLIHSNLEPFAITELERMLRLSEDVIRHLLIRLDEVMTPPVDEEEAIDEEPVEAVVEEAVDAEVESVADAEVEEEEPAETVDDEPVVVEEAEDDTQEDA